jgi:hypothetical protein
VCPHPKNFFLMQRRETLMLRDACRPSQVKRTSNGQSRRPCRGNSGPSSGQCHPYLPLAGASLSVQPRPRDLTLSNRRAPFHSTFNVERCAFDVQKITPEPLTIGRILDGTQHTSTATREIGVQVKRGGPDWSFLREFQSGPLTWTPREVEQGVQVRRGRRRIIPAYIIDTYVNNAEN